MRKDLEEIYTKCAELSKIVKIKLDNYNEAYRIERKRVKKFLNIGEFKPIKQVFIEFLKEHDTDLDFYNQWTTKGWSNKLTEPKNYIKLAFNWDYVTLTKEGFYIDNWSIWKKLNDLWQKQYKKEMEDRA